jgi:hypothetical protein
VYVFARRVWLEWHEVGEPGGAEQRGHYGQLIQTCDQGLVKERRSHNAKLLATCR